MLPAPEVCYIPSTRMVRDYGPAELQFDERIRLATLHAQDLGTFFDYGGISTMAVFDGAKDLAGTKWDVPDLAAGRGLDGAKLDGGEIASSVMQRYVEDNPAAVGIPLVSDLNQALLETYREIGLAVDHEHREKLFTGYIGHVRITPETVTVTGVGDVRVQINGKLVVGVEKEIDRLYFAIIAAAATALRRDRQEIYQTLMPVLNLHQFKFQNYVRMNGRELTQFWSWLTTQVSGLLDVSYRRAQELVEPHINENSPVWYPAIDGTATPDAGVQVATLARDGLKTIVVHTDGFEPLAAGHAVRSLRDLKPVNPDYSEQLAMVLDLTSA